MGKGNATILDVLKVAFLNNYDPSWRTNANLYLALHTADPTASGDQTSNEVTTGAYASYARVAVAKTAGGWTVSGTTSVNAALVQFPQCTGGTGATVTHVSIGTLTSGAGQILYSGSLNSPLAVSNLIQPQFIASALSTSES